MASTIKVDNVQNQPGTNIINKCSTTITIGASSDTVALAAGASQTGFGRTGTVDWETTPQTGSFQATTGKGYFMNTTSGALTLTTPGSPSAGDIFAAADYAATWQTNALTIAPHAGVKIGGVAQDAALSTEGQSVTFVYVDSTRGWINTMDSTSNVQGNAYIQATGGTISCSGDYKIHKFTGPGTFAVTSAAGCAANNVVSYLVVAGGGSGGSDGTYTAGGGGGAGGTREYKNTCDPYTASPLNGNPGGTAVTVSATPYSITVGGGMAAVPCSSPINSNAGNPSVFSTITSTNGGAGATSNPTLVPAGLSIGEVGGSGGAAGHGTGPSGGYCGGAGNTPPTTPAQGFAGGAGDSGGAPPGAHGSGGGGGAGALGGDGTNAVGGSGGAGVSTTISATPTAYGGGGGGGTWNGLGVSAGTGGTGGGGPAGVNGGGCGTAGTVNLGGGGGGASGCNTPTTPRVGGNGGSGIVIIRYRYK